MGFVRGVESSAGGTTSVSLGLQPQVPVSHTNESRSDGILDVPRANGESKSRRIEIMAANVVPPGLAYLETETVTSD